MDQNNATNPLIPTEIQHHFPILKVLGILLIVLAILFVAFYFVSDFWTPSYSYIVPNVPYFGIFSATALNTDVHSSVATILRYWGDERLDFETISYDIFRPTKFFSLENIRDFFKGQGYHAEIHEYKDLNDLSVFISEEKNIPLILIRRLSNGKDLPPLYGASVVIGVNGNTIVLHDHILGNNYNLFVKNLDLLNDKEHKFLAVSPPAELLALFKKVPSMPYEKRLKIMDSPEIQDLNFRWAALVSGIFKGDSPSQTLLNWEEISNHPAFEQFPPRARMYVYSEIAAYYRTLGDYEESVRILLEKAIPLNYDLDKDFGEWKRPPGTPKMMALPWFYLGDTYAAKGDVLKAREAYNKALEIEPENPFAKNGLNRL